MKIVVCTCRHGQPLCASGKGDDTHHFRDFSTPIVSRAGKPWGPKSVFCIIIVTYLNFSTEKKSHFTINSFELTALSHIFTGEEM